MKDKSFDEYSARIEAKSSELLARNLEIKKPRNAPLTIELNGFVVDALEDFLRHESHAYRVAAGLAEERYQGEARNLVDIYGKNLATRLCLVVEDLAHESPLADAFADEKVARNEYMNSETYAEAVRDQVSRNDPKS